MQIHAIRQQAEECFQYPAETFKQAYFAPGRINLIGEHLDYNLGHVLPAAISLGIYAVVRARSDQQFRFASTAFPSIYSFQASENLGYDAFEKWGNYPKGILRFLAKQLARKAGLDILFHSTLPIGSGLSSSACLSVLTAYICSQQYQLSLNRTEIAQLAQQVENQFIGLQCGIMDQYAIAHGRAEQAILLDCDQHSHRYIPVHLGEYELVIMDSCKARELIKSAYNERRAACERALESIQKHKAISKLTSAQENDLQWIKDENDQKRAQHIIQEEKRVHQSAAALQKHDIQLFGELLNQSHHSLKHLYEVSGQELDTLVAAAQSVEGCVGARMTGAGFGGCAIALVHHKQISYFKQTVQANYRTKIGYDCRLYEAKLVDGVKSCIFV